MTMLRFRPDGWRIASELNSIVYSGEKRGLNRWLRFTLSEEFRTSSPEANSMHAALEFGCLRPHE